MVLGVGLGVGLGLRFRVKVQGLGLPHVHLSKFVFSSFFSGFLRIGDFLFGVLFWTQLLGSDEVLAWVLVG